MCRPKAKHSAAEVVFTNNRVTCSSRSINNCVLDIAGLLGLSYTIRQPHSYALFASDPEHECCVAP